MHAGEGICYALQVLFTDFPVPVEIFLIQKILDYQLGNLGADRTDLHGDHLVFLSLNV